MSFWLEGEGSALQGEAWAEVAEAERRAGVPGVLATPAGGRDRRRRKRSRLSNAVTVIGVTALGLVMTYALLSMLGIRQAWLEATPDASSVDVGTLGRLTLPFARLGLAASVATAVAPERGTISVPPVCVAPATGMCTQAEGFEQVRLVDQARPERVAHVETINGRASWRHYIAAVSPGIVMQPLRVRGQPGFFVPASGETGGAQFLQWDEPTGLSVILDAPEGAFTEPELLAIADALEVETVSVDVVRPVTQVRGVPAPGVFTPDKSNGYIPPIIGYHHSTYLTSLSSSRSRCLGLGANSACVPVRYSNGIGYLAGRGETWPVGFVAGIVPSSARHVVVALDGRPPISVAPSASGPSSDQRYFAQWLPRSTDRPTTIVTLNDHGAPINRATLPSPPHLG